MAINKNIFKIFAGVVFTFVFVLLGLNNAGAAGISVSPLTFELNANPGDTVSNILRVFNTTDTPLLVDLEVENFAPVGEEGRVILEPADNNVLSLANWTSIEPRSVVVPPNDFVPVEFTISVPLNAEPGGHYASILATLSGQAPDGSGAVIVQKVGSLVLLHVAGDVREELEVVSLDVPGFSQYGPVTLSARFENTGSVHVRPRGFILIQNIFGQEVAKLDMTQSNVLPNSIRRIDTEFDKKWLFGKYTATLTAIYGSGNVPVSYTASFWVVPWKETSAISVVALILLIGLFKMRRRIAHAFRILFKGVPE